jgi:light-regulated signal transduction histidine kinase (bacteriophytochrome)
LTADGDTTAKERALAAPAFGEADLSNCEREQVHLAGSIQPHGVLLVVSEPDHVVIQASANAAEALGLLDMPLGRSINEIPGDLCQRIRPLLDDPLLRMPHGIRCLIGNPALDFDALLHRPVAGGLVIELERSSPARDLSKDVDRAIRTIVASDSLAMLCDESARLLKALIAYDRIMVYRFDDNGHGEVIAEQRAPTLEPFLGLRYPASDIPQIARELYKRNRIRLLVDVDYTPVPLLPAISPITGQPLDMSLCFLRSMSPIHIQYLKNMGVAATLVASLVVAGRLWGLIACHHYSPRHVPYATRAACELLAETMATRIAALESFQQGNAELTVRHLEQRMVAAISRAGDWRSAIWENPKALLQPLEATGAALLFRHDIVTVGEVPGTGELRAIGEWLDRQRRRPVIATPCLGLEDPSFAALKDVASGVCAVPVSSTPGEYLMWLRPEQVRTITWGGDPTKPVVVGNDPADLSPRRSFAQWHQLVEGTSHPWTQADLAAARLMGETVAGVLLQFRSVRMLIAQDQLNALRQQIGASELPVAIADRRGTILLTNAGFESLLGASSSQIRHVDDLPQFFADADEARQRLHDLLTIRRSWRGAGLVKAGNAGETPVQIAADPVMASADRLLGFIIQLTDLGERKAADSARLRFQDEVLAQHRLKLAGFGAGANPFHRKLLAAVVGNAQLAAFEIAHTADVARIPESLESVRTSVSRTAELLELLMEHAEFAARQNLPKH